MVSDLPRNYGLFFHFLHSQMPATLPCRVLDYGCGNGLVMREGIRRGYQMFGVDTFYGDEVQAKIILSRTQADGLPIRTLATDGTIPYPDGFFAAIISNQVIEHIVDLDLAVSEMYRVLQEGGVMLHVFPTKECILEGHIGIPLVHWFPPKRYARNLWVLLVRKLGFGFSFGIGAKSDREWISDALAWMDKYVFYRSWQEIKRVFSRYFEIKSYTR